MDIGRVDGRFIGQAQDSAHLRSSVLPDSNNGSIYSVIQPSTQTHLLQLSNLHITLHDLIGL